MALMGYHRFTGETIFVEPVPNTTLGEGVNAQELTSPHDGQYVSRQAA